MARANPWPFIAERFRPHILARDAYRCQLQMECCESPELPLPPHRLEVDHIVAVSQGGRVDDVMNMRAVCRPCHYRKTTLERGNRPSRRWRRPKVVPPVATPMDLTR